MIVKIKGLLIEKRDQSLVVLVQGLNYEVLVPASVLARIDDHVNDEGCVELITYHYVQLTQASGVPIMIGFLNEVERDFFQQFIKVSGIGPRAAIKALNKPISEISQAIDGGDVKYLKTLPGIGLQRAKEIVAKLQGKVSKFGLIQDSVPSSVSRDLPVTDWQEEALEVLQQLQYKNNEAMDMIVKAMERKTDIGTTEELLNEIYKQRMTP